jgi:hypothetical protein
MPENNNPSSSPAPNPPPPIPEKARPFLAWLSWFLLLIGPTAGLMIPRLTTGILMEVLTAILGLLVAAAVAIRTGLVNPFKAGRA